MWTKARIKSGFIIFLLLSAFESRFSQHWKVVEKIQKMPFRCKNMCSFEWSNQIWKISPESWVIRSFHSRNGKSVFRFCRLPSGKSKISGDWEEIFQIGLHHSKERIFLHLYMIFQIFFECFSMSCQGPSKSGYVLFPLHGRLHKVDLSFVRGSGGGLCTAGWLSSQKIFL